MNPKRQTTSGRRAQIHGLTAFAAGLLALSTVEQLPDPFFGELHGGASQLRPEVRRMFEWAHQMAVQAQSPVPDSFWRGHLQWSATNLAGGWWFSNNRYQVAAGEQNGRWFSWQLRTYSRGGKRVANRSPAEMEARIHATYARLGLRLGREYHVEKRFPSSPKDPSRLTIRMRNRTIAANIHSHMEATYDLRCDCIVDFSAKFSPSRFPNGQRRGK